MPDRNALPRSSTGAWLVLLAGLISTGIATYAVKSRIDSDALHQFDSDCQEIQQKIEGRLQTHRLVLLGGAALFDASGRQVSRDEWRTYARRVEIDQHFNGIQGLGFSLLIPKERLAGHLSGIRAEGFPDYAVRPAGEREVYSSIIYLEPFEGRNLRAFGYDMYSEPVRRTAMEQARDENTAALSGKVVLVQETGQDVQAGTLMYVPVYRKTMPIETVVQRRAALYGWAYSPFRMNDLLRGILDFKETRGAPNLHLRVYDGHRADAPGLLYDSEAGRQSASPASAMSLERRMDFNGREWLLHFEQLKSGAPGYGTAWLVFSSGMGLSLLSFLLMHSYLNTRREAAHIADSLTAELRKTSGYTRSLIEASLDPFVTISPEGKITDVNHATEKATGLHHAKLVGTDFSDYFTEPDKARAGYRQAFMEGSVTDYPLAIRRPDGRIIEVLYNASVYHDEDGNVLGVFAAARDVTERKRAEEKIRRINAELEQRVAERTASLEAANQELEEFTYSVAHDLRIPLRAIDGFAHLLSARYGNRFDEEGQRLLNVVQDNTRKMGQMIDDMLAFTHVGRQSMSVSDVDMNSLVRAVFDEFGPTVAGRELSMEIGPLPPASCDADMLRKVWSGLLSNAIKFTRPKAIARIEVGGTVENGELVYHVRDNGVGFDPRYAHKLFGVSQRLHGVEEFEGAGIGLAIVKRIVTRHGGRVWAEGKIGEGAAFYFALPQKA